MSLIPDDEIATASPQLGNASTLTGFILAILACVALSLVCLWADYGMRLFSEAKAKSKEDLDKSPGSEDASDGGNCASTSETHEPTTDNNPAVDGLDQQGQTRGDFQEFVGQFDVIQQKLKVLFERTEDRQRTLLRKTRREYRATIRSVKASAGKVQQAAINAEAILKQAQADHQYIVTNVQTLNLSQARLNALTGRIDDAETAVKAFKDLHKGHKADVANFGEDLAEVATARTKILRLEQDTKEAADNLQKSHLAAISHCDAIRLLQRRAADGYEAIEDHYATATKALCGAEAAQMTMVGKIADFECYIKEVEELRKAFDLVRSAKSD